MKKIPVIMVTALCLGAMGSLTVFAANITNQQAKEAVSAYVPSGAEYLKTDLEHGAYEIEYYNQAKGEKYEFKVSQSGGNLISFESRQYNHHGGSLKKLTESDAQNKVTGELNKAQILSTVLQYDDGMEYEVKFKTDSLYGEYTIHPETGAILERDIKIGTLPSYTTDGLLSREQAIEIAKKQVYGATVTDVDLDRDHNRYEYEIQLSKDGTEYTYTIDAITGSILSSKSETEDWSWYKDSTAAQETSAATVSDIGIEKAKEIVLKKVPGAVIKKLEREYDDGRLIYEGELQKDGWEYDFEIDGTTGAILEWEAEQD